MARQTTLANLRLMLKAEVGQSVNTAFTQKDSIFNTLLSDTQKWLAGEYDWPFLEDRWDTVLGVGTRYYNNPTTAQVAGANNALNFERPVRAQTKWNQTWQDVEYGIGVDEYNYVDSDLGETQDPVQRWRMASEAKYEVWPIPASGSQTLRFEGQRVMDTLSADGDTADLDDMLIVYFAAANLLQSAGMKNAPIMLAAAQQRLARLRGSYSSRTREYIIGGQDTKGATRIVPMKIVTVHG